jgi:phage terminase large subunit GpA-like protein
MTASERSLGEKAIELFRGVIVPVFTPRPRQSMADWADANVIVPEIAGSPYPGQLNSNRLPMWRGLLRRLEQRRIRFFNLAKSARTGGSLFFGIVPVLHKIVTRPGPILWLDPTTKTARRLSRQELQPFIRACRATNELRIRDRKAWTTLEMIFKTCTFGVVGAGSVADLGGRQAEMIIVNEKDKIPAKARAEAPPGLLVLVRSKLFRRTRKIISNSTPTLESAETWGDFLAGSQTFGYLPCPECHGYQPLTFFKEPAQPDKWMRVEDDDPILIGYEIEKADREGVELPADSARDAGGVTVTPTTSATSTEVDGDNGGNGYPHAEGVGCKGYAPEAGKQSSKDANCRRSIAKSSPPKTPAAATSSKAFRRPAASGGPPVSRTSAAKSGTSTK